jgi:type 1 glutamine amidotransferase
VLIVTATAGFRHDSIATARQAMSSLAAASGVFTVTSTEDLATITSANLANFEVVCFALTSGELPLNVDQRSALLAFVSGGGGFIGAHSATDTFYDWPEYGRLIGAYFKEHPWTRIGLVDVENSSHPINGGSVRFSINEEFYTFRDNPRANTTVLWRLDAASVGASGDYPLAWAHAYGSGRVYYNALGHFSATWLDSSFQRHLIAAIQWVAKRTG